MTDPEQRPITTAQGELINKDKTKQCHLSLLYMNMVLRQLVQYAQVLFQRKPMCPPPYISHTNSFGFEFDLLSSVMTLKIMTRSAKSYHFFIMPHWNNLNFIPICPLVHTISCTHESVTESASKTICSLHFSNGTYINLSYDIASGS